MKYFPNLNASRAELLKMLDRTGTPIFLCERDIVVDRYKELDRSLEDHWGSHVIGYSFKTNYLIAKSRILQDLGAWAEVVSEREYQMARELEYTGPTIIYNGPLKPDDSLRAAMADGALININDHDELDRVIALASHETAPLDIGIRISSTLPRLGHSRFGFSMENSEAAAAVAKLQNAPAVNLVSLHTHLFGDTDDAEIYRIAAERLGMFARNTIKDYRHVLKFVDMGGGYPAHGLKPKSRSTWNPQSIDVYVEQIARGLRPFFPNDGPSPTLVVEPGRYLTCDGIVLVTRVVHVKSRNDKQMINCDGSISMISLTHYRPQIINAFTPEFARRNGDETATVIQGSTCREDDLLFDGAFPRVQPGDYLVHFAAGAYNANFCPDFIFSSPVMEVF